MKATPAFVIGLTLLFSQVLAANPGGIPACPPTSHDPACRTDVPEPAPLQELALYGAATAVGFAMWRRKVSDARG